MDKNAIKKYAVWARRELIERVSQRAMFYGVTSEEIGNPNAAEVHGRLLSPVEKKQRQALIQNVKEKGFNQVMEEVAYTWFNRFAALRFMEVNGYLPSLVRVFTNEAGEFKPQILSEALHLDLEGLDKQKVLELESGNKSEELFRYLLIVQCNALNSILPGMFQKIEDYTELLFPDNLLRDGSVIEQMVTSIPEEDWTDQVQIIGWLYQYYNTEPKDKVFADLKKNIKITKENIPAATQLFTPDWIVHYMVENSLGRLWLEGHPNDALKSEWKYYLDEAEQEPEVQAQLAEIRKEYAALKPEEIKVIDPCCGSGHILVVMFDVLVQIYEDYGYTAREAASQILENNLWGLDIDERAAQLSYFAVMMKARQYDRRFFTREVQPHVYAIEESNGISTDLLEYFAGSDISSYYSGRNVPPLLNDIVSITNDLRDAKEYGSIINVHDVDFDALYARFEEIKNEEAFELSSLEALHSLLPVVKVGQVLSQKYHIVVTNPPYMSSGGMDDCLSNYVKTNYPDSKSDMFAVFIERARSFCKHGYYAMITQPSLITLASYEKTRKKMITDNTLISLLHMGRGIFGIDFGSTAFIGHDRHVMKYMGRFFKLYERTFQYIDPDDIAAIYLMAKCNNSLRLDYQQYDTATGIDPCISTNGCQVSYCVKEDDFLNIPGNPFAITASKQVFYLFAQGKIRDHAVTCNGFTTGDNNRFLRFWYEVQEEKIKYNAACFDDTLEKGKKWFPYNKGGAYRKWYGNNEYVINWEQDGQELRNYKGLVPRSLKYMFHPCISWSKISAGAIAFRYKEGGQMFDVAGLSMFPNEANQLFYLLGLCNSKVALHFANILSPTMNYEVGHIASFPVVVKDEEHIAAMSKKCVEIAKNDWDDQEISWNFKKHPMIFETNKLEEAYAAWIETSLHRIKDIKEMEEAINTSLAEIYGLEDEISVKVDDKDITLHLPDINEDIRSFISYSVGCMFGRFSLDVPGIACGGGVWNPTLYITFRPDQDAVIPICDDEYFEDDIVSRFEKFVETVYGKDTLEENLRFIADALGGKGSSREVIRNYFINDFYADHLKVYQKRPIYWLFDSGKKNGFKCLIYMHRYQPDTIARIRTDYVHEQQSRYRTVIADLEHRVAGASPSERVKLTKQLSKVRDQAEELRVYEEKIHHLADQMISIDLDDGVKVNYAKFQDVLARIK